MLIVDADPLTAQVIVHALEEDGRLRPAAVSADAREAVRLAGELRPDLVVLEPRSLGGVEQLGLVGRLIGAAGDVRVVLFSAAPDPALEIGALRQGALGVVNKEEGVPALLDALARVAAGEVVISGALAMRVIRQLRRAPLGSAGLRPVRSPLTNREWEVLDLLAEGRTTREVSEHLFLTEDTVYSHVKSLMRKLDVHTRANAVLAAERLRGSGGS